jgi:hypothetical protein
VRDHVAEIVRRQLLHAFKPSQVLGNLAEIKQFLEKLPLRLNHVMDRIADNELRLRVDAIDEKQLMSGFQKVANRITVGLILAAMIIGAAMLMNIQTSWTFFGYPALAVLLFAFAFLMGAGLIFNIFWNDTRPPHEPRI